MATADGLVKKRKADRTAEPSDRKIKKANLKTFGSDDSIAQVERLEAQILKSQKNYNKINELLDFAKNHELPATRRLACLSLCTIFLEFISDGKFSPEAVTATKDNIVERWLAKRYELFCDVLLDLMTTDYPLASGLIMQLVKTEVSKASSNSVWSGLYSKAIQRVLSLEDPEEFFEDNVLPYKDNRMYACKAVRDLPEHTSLTIDNAISLLEEIPFPSEDVEELNVCLTKLPPQSKRKPPSNTIYKKTTEEAWLSILRSNLNSAQRKTLLELVPETIAPWFTRPELLTDFLVDSFNTGGALSLTALSGIFYLIQHRNLDYPQFYTKVYSLIDSHILHSKQRPQFLRLMNTFLDSTHLPEALVASFMKRLSRLCLFAPPAAIIAIVPWLYNKIKDHPATAFMLHRVRSSSTLDIDAAIGSDPFNFSSPDPLQTGASQSSLWEIETLSSHYNPHVATIASILGKPFFKTSYKLDDFLDYTYHGMLDDELDKALKKAPVVEFQIPKRIFVRDDDHDDDDEQRSDRMEVDLLRQIWDFS